jgi:hypothetical protein
MEPTRTHTISYERIYFCLQILHNGIGSFTKFVKTVLFHPNAMKRCLLCSPYLHNTCRKKRTHITSTKKFQVVWNMVLDKRSFYSLCPDWEWGPASLLVNECRGLFTWWYSDWGMNVTIHLPSSANDHTTSKKIKII